MKLAETIFLSLAVAFFIIGVHQTFFVGIIESYWLFMLSVAMLLLYRMKKTSDTHSEAKPTTLKQTQSKRQKKPTTPKVKSRK